MLYFASRARSGMCPCLRRRLQGTGEGDAEAVNCLSLLAELRVVFPRPPRSQKLERWKDRKCKNAHERRPETADAVVLGRSPAREHQGSDQAPAAGSARARYSSRDIQLLFFSARRFWNFRSALKPSKNAGFQGYDVLESAPAIIDFWTCCLGLFPGHLCKICYEREINTARNSDRTPTWKSGILRRLADRRSS